MTNTNIFTSIVLGIVFLSVIFGFIVSSTEMNEYSDSISMDFTNDTSLTFTYDAESLTSFLYDDGVTFPESAYTLNLPDEIVINDITSLNSSSSLTATYEYKGDGYLNNTTIRVIILLIPIFLAIYLLTKNSSSK